MHSLVSDLRFAFRQLRRTPGFTAVSLIVLGLGLGANLTIFSLANAVLLRPPSGVESTEGMFRLLSRSDQDRDFEDSLSYPDFVDLGARLDGQATLAAYDHSPMSVRVGDETSRVRGALVAGSYFEILGQRAVQGRLLNSGDNQSPATGQVVVLSHAFWRDRLGGRAEALGERMSINGTSYEIAGVLSPRFRGVDPFDQADLWVPMIMQQSVRPSRGNLLEQRESTWMSVVGRLAPGAKTTGLEPVLSSFTRKISSDPDDTRLREFDVIGGLGPGPSDRRTAMMMMGGLLALVGLVLIIACANVANLVLARTQRRTSEMAVRRALGAGRGRLVRQLLTENLTLSLLAAGVGLVLALVLRGSLLGLLPDFVSGELDLPIDTNVLLYALLLATMSGLVFGLAPLLSRKGRAAIATSRVASGGGRLRSALVVGQLALSVVLLMSAGLLLETLRRLQDVPTGFDSAQVATAAVDLGIQNYSGEETVRFVDQTLASLESRPDIDAVATATTLPLSWSADSWGGLQIEGHEAPAGRPGWSVQVNTVSPGFFATLDIPLRAGRDFGPDDTAGAPPKIVVNEALVERFWPGGVLGALGKTIRTHGDDGILLEVIGVAGDARYRSPSEPIRPMMYVSQTQRPDSRLSILARATTGSNPDLAADAIRAEVKRIDGDLPTFAVAPLAQIERQSLWQQRMVGSLLTLFGGLALLLAAVGLYGVVACLVAERRREIGIRLAVGADPKEVVRLFVGGSLRLAALAIGFGLLGSLAAGRMLGNVLYGVSPLPPLTVAAVVTLLMLASFAAALGPATLASRLDPSKVLRES